MFVAPLIPVNSEYAQDIYVMTFQALKEAEERRRQQKRIDAYREAVTRVTNK